MFRVFKWRSPMSVGSWTLLAFGGATVAALAAHELGLAGPGASAALRALSWAASAAAALSGLVMATYTGVLLGATSIPVWHERRALLPGHMAVAALGSAAALLRLLVPGAEPVTRLLWLAAGLECAFGVAFELDRRRSGRPLHQGASAWLMRAGGLLAGPAALAGLALQPRWTWAGAAASVAFLAGALLLRYGWIAAGRASAADPAATLEHGVRSRT
jgi:hypothetical protein